MVPRLVQRFHPTVAALLAATLLVTPRAWADKVILKDGRELEGHLAQIAKVAEDPLKNPDPTALTPILLCDNELTRIMVPVSRVREPIPAADPPFESFKIPQPVAESGMRVGGVGPIIQITPFDSYGRRTFSMSTVKGRVDVIQGITKITPIYTQVEGLHGGNSYVWDMRVATSSIPLETLRKIIRRHIDPKKFDDRVRLVKLLMQANRYRDAAAELAGVIKDFPSEDAARQQDAGVRQLASRMLLAEIQARKRAGQHRLAYALLKQFPAEGVAGNILQEVRQELEQYAANETTRLAVIARLRELLAQVDPPSLRDQFAPSIEEIATELSINTLDRMSAFRRLEGDAQLSPPQRLALAISGWLLGGDEADVNQKVALSLLEMRDLVRKYMNESVKLQRDEIYRQLMALEGASPQLLASLIARLKPPLQTDVPDATDALELQTPGAPGEGNHSYLVLLPPEYDPYRRYPAVVTLHGAGSTPALQLDWWAGPRTEKGRLGQATRQGYIVIAPLWTQPHQTSYNASPEEHQAVLAALRDACRRFAIDTDRVYLSGHSMGGDAAWDIGVSHPDLWAGIIPIVATSTRNYVSHYTANAANLPMYFLGGELDGDKMQTNAIDLDRYFTRNFDVTVVEYRGRGHEHFSDDILNLFDWMGRKQRDFFPKKITAATKRPSDNYFWWIESESVPSPSGVRAFPVEGTVNAANGINVRAPGQVSVWLSPEFVDFAKPISVTINGRTVKKAAIAPDARVLLEDVRTRGERRRPFWARVEATAR